MQTYKHGIYYDNFASFESDISSRSFNNDDGEWGLYWITLSALSASASASAGAARFPRALSDDDEWGLPGVGQLDDDDDAISDDDDDEKELVPLDVVSVTFPAASASNANLDTSSTISSSDLAGGDVPSINEILKIKRYIQFRIY